MRLPVFTTRSWLVGALLLLVAVGCQPNAPVDSGAFTKPVPRDSARSTPAAPRQADAVVFDVPLLLTKNIDQIGHLLGSPKEPDSANLTEDELERHYAAKAYQLVITYNTKTREAASILITPASGPTKDCSKLLAAGNLAAGDPNYSVDSLSGDKQGYFYSLVATKNQ